jgi:hypothetical protein
VKYKSIILADHPQRAHKIAFDARNSRVILTEVTKLTDMTKADEARRRGPIAPNPKVVKRLFVLSGNRCAFPKCISPIVQVDVVVGEICHIKAASPGGPRYDPAQSPEERHGYDNLILLCASHHKVVDDDTDAYTVTRLLKMKLGHEQNVSVTPENQLAEGVRLLIDQSITATGQSGGITAHTVNVHVHGGSRIAEDKPELPRRFLGTGAKDGNARYRAVNEPIGVHESPIPFEVVPEQNVTLSAGAAMWLRVMPCFDVLKTWSIADLRQAAIYGSRFNLMPFIHNDWANLSAEDGFGVYLTWPERHETSSVAFAFETGEIWSIDTAILGISRDAIYFGTISEVYIEGLQNYSRFLAGLGVTPPYQWMAGLEGVKGRRLKVPPPPNHTSLFPGPTCLADGMTAEGTYDCKESPISALVPFFRAIFRKCGIDLPAYLER